MAVVDINGVKAQAVRDELRAKGIRAISIKADITKADACNRCASTSADAFAMCAMCCYGSGSIWRMTCSGVCLRILILSSLQVSTTMSCLNITIEGAAMTFDTNCSMQVSL